MEMRKKSILAATALTVLVITLGLFTACTDETLVEYEVPAVSTAATTTSSSQTYTLTVHATKGEAATKALILADEGTAEESLDAVWMTTETIYVYKGDTYVGWLMPQEDNVAQTLLKGKVIDVALNDELTLEFLSPYYATQDGTLGYIAAHCDYATASVKVLEINGTEVTTTGADFENQQSIVKFTLQDNDNPDADISITQMFVSADGHVCSIKPSADTNEFFVALPGFSEKDIQVTATNGTDIYTFVRENATLENGKYYALTMQMDKVVGKVVDLSTLSEDYVAQSGDILTGEIDNSIKISIANGAFVTLSDAYINAGKNISGDTPWAGITCLGHATITLVGDNVVNACSDGSPGIQAGPKNTILTINGRGSIYAYGGSGGAGIGGGYESGAGCGDIYINDLYCYIEAHGGDGGAGIGGGRNSRCGDISVTASLIYANGSNGGSAIGSGSVAGCGDIYINVGYIEARGGSGGAGIGGLCGHIFIADIGYGIVSGGSEAYDIGPRAESGGCISVVVQDDCYIDGMRIFGYNN